MPKRKDVENVVVFGEQHRRGDYHYHYEGDYQPKPFFKYFLKTIQKLDFQLETNTDDEDYMTLRIRENKEQMMFMRYQNQAFPHRIHIYLDETFIDTLRDILEKMFPNATVSIEVRGY